jgi:hypothetical protein
MSLTRVHRREIIDYAAFDNPSRPRVMVPE